MVKDRYIGDTMPEEMMNSGQTTKQTVTPEMVRSLVNSYLGRVSFIDAGASRADATNAVDKSPEVTKAIDKLNKAIELNPGYNTKYARYLNDGQINVLNRVQDVRVAVETELKKWDIDKSFNGTDFQHTLATALGMEIHEIEFTKGAPAANRAR